MMTLRHSSAFLRASALSLILSTAAHADEITTSWRLQGPAFSHHFSTELAPLRGGEVKNDGMNIPPRVFKYSDYTPGDNTQEYCGKFAVALIGTDHYPDLVSRARSLCLDKLQVPYVQGAQRRWNQKNLELGAEYDIRNATTKTVQRYYVGAVVDSFFKPGVYVGTSYQKTLYDGPRFRLDAGATAMLWWRTVAGEMVPAQLPVVETAVPLVSTEGESLWIETLRRRVVPAVLPVVSIEDKSLGVGVNISFVPKIQIKEKIYSVNTLIVQLTWAL
jgi:hypothetical protein